MNVRIYLITDATVSIVDSRLRLLSETVRKECNLHFITNGWASLATFVRTTKITRNNFEDLVKFEFPLQR